MKQQISPKENAENRNNRKKSWLIHRLSYTEELAVGSETLQTELRYQAHVTGYIYPESFDMNVRAQVQQHYQHAD